MSDRDRLIELHEEAGKAWNCYIDKCLYNDELPNKTYDEYIADHLLANGVIVPPCKVEDTVYVIENPYTFLPFKKPLEGVVVSIHQHEHGLYARVLFDTKKINGCVDYNLNWRLNKDFFLSREDAVKELEKRYG